MPEITSAFPEQVLLRLSNLTFEMSNQKSGSIYKTLLMAMVLTNGLIWQVRVTNGQVARCYYDKSRLKQF